MLKDSSGKDFNLASLKGKVILLDFWATWCPPCKVEIPWFVEFQQKYGPAGLQVIGVSLVLLSIRWHELRLFALTAMWAVVVFGLASAVDYFRKFWRKVDMGIKLRRRNELIMMERQKRRLQRAQRAQQESKTAIRRSG